MMWFGITMFLNPLVMIFRVLPAVGRLASGVVGAAAAVIALILSTVTILISMVLHSWLAIVIALIVAAVLFGGYFRRLRAKDAGASPMATPAV